MALPKRLPPAVGQHKRLYILYTNKDFLSHPSH